MFTNIHQLDTETIFEKLTTQTENSTKLSKSQISDKIKPKKKKKTHRKLSSIHSLKTYELEGKEMEDLMKMFETVC